jgi:hypothetical protein
MDEIEVKKSKGSLIVICIVVLAVIAIGVGGIYIPKYQKIRDAKEKVANQLKDPSSAQFKNLKFDGSVVCGEVNGKNSMGGYVGYAQFHVFGNSVLVDTNEDEYMGKIAKKLCDKTFK